MYDLETETTDRACVANELARMRGEPTRPLVLSENLQTMYDLHVNATNFLSEELSIENLCGNKDGRYALSFLDLNCSSKIQEEARLGECECLFMEIPDYCAEWYEEQIDAGSDDVIEDPDALREMAKSEMILLGYTLESALAEMVMAAGLLQSRVEEYKAEVESGIATMMGRTMNRTVAALPTGEEYEAQAASTVRECIDLWTSVGTRVDEGLRYFAQGLENTGLSRITRVFNSSMQMPLSNASAVSSGMLRMLEGVAGIANSTGTSDVAEYERVVDELFVAKDASVMFPGDFKVAFTRLHETVLSYCRSMLNDTAVTQVMSAFDNAERQAEVAGRALSGATEELIAYVDTGLRAARPPNARHGGAASRLHASGGAALLLLALLHLLAS